MEMTKYGTTAIEQYVIDKIRDMRKEKGLSQKQLGNLADLSIGFIGDVESPKSRAKYNLNHINIIAKVLKCSPRDFLPEDSLL